MTETQCALDTANQAGGSAGTRDLRTHCDMQKNVFKETHTHTLKCSKLVLLLSHRCDSGNLNGHYYNGPYQAMTDDGVVWYTWHGWWYSVKSVIMMVRAADLEHLPPVLANLPEQLDASKAAGSELAHGWQAKRKNRGGRCLSKLSYSWFSATSCMSMFLIKRVFLTCTSVYPFIMCPK